VLAVVSAEPFEVLASAVVAGAVSVDAGVDVEVLEAVEVDALGSVVAAGSEVEVVGALELLVELVAVVGSVAVVEPSVEVLGEDAVVFDEVELPVEAPVLGALVLVLVVLSVAGVVDVAGAVGVVELEVVEPGVDEVVVEAVLLFVLVGVEEPFVDVVEFELLVVDVEAVPPGCAVTTVDDVPGQCDATALTHATSPFVASASAMPVDLSAGTFATATPVCELKLVI